MKYIYKTIILSPWLYRFIRISLGALFVWAGCVKLMDPRAFARVISGYGIVPDELLVPIALGLPALELIAGSGLILDLRGSLNTVFALVMLFLLVLGFGILNDLNVDCGCFSTAELNARSSLRDAFLRDLGFMGMTLYLFLWRFARARVRSGAKG